MFNPSLLIALGPCLLMAMAAVALLVVHRYLSPVRHALVWSGAFAASASQWGLIASQGLRGGPPFHGGIAADLLGLGSICLYVEGFRLRQYPGRWRAVLPVIGLISAAILVGSAVGPPMILRAAINPGVSALLLAWGATMVISRGRHASTAESAVVAMLVSLATIDALAALLAVGEQVGLLATHRYYLLLYAATIEPSCAAITMFTLLLIAFDFSADLRRLVHTDPLTGVLNRLGFEHALRSLAHGRKQRPRTLSLAIADIDFFKEINDRHGHAAGDATLASFAGHLAKSLGHEARVARIGGEEFALLLPGIDGRRAFERIDPLRESIAAMKVADHPTLTVTASFGVAERRPAEDLESLIERADRALYRSKREGRNRSTLADALRP